MSVVDIATGEIVEPLDEGDARRLTNRIRLLGDSVADSLEKLAALVNEARARGAWSALGYASWPDYVSREFAGLLPRLDREPRQEFVRELYDAGMSVRAIAPVAGVSHMTVQRDIESGVTDVTPRPEPSDRPKPAPTTGLDGKSYSRPAPIDWRARADAAVEEFPDLAYHFDLGEYVDVANMGDDLRRYHERGELEMRLDNLRRSIAVDRAHRDGSYRPGMAVAMGPDGVYEMRPMTQPVTTTVPCPTCHGAGTITKEESR